MNFNELKRKVEKFDKKAEKFYYSNELLLAEHYANVAYRIATKVFEPNSLLIANLQHNIATFLRLRKAFQASATQFKKSIEIKSNVSEPNYLAVSINALGYIYRTIGDYQKAYNSFLYAVEISIDKDKENLAAFYYDLARIQKITNNIQEACHTYQKSILEAKGKIALTKPENHKFYEQLVYFCYNDLSEIELSKSNPQESKIYHQKALQILENSKSDLNTFFEGHKRFSIPAKIDIKEGNYEEAIEKLQKAKAAIIEEYKGFEVGKDLANIIHQIGDCYIQQKQYKQALSTYQNALFAVCNTFKNEAPKQLPAIEDIYNKRSAIASLSYKAATFLLIFNNQNNTEALEQAYETYLLITKLIPVTRRDYVEENSKFQLADETKNIYEKAIETCLSLYDLNNEESYLQQAFYFAESSKAIVLQESLQANFALEGVDESIQRQDIDYRSKIAFYENSINTNKTIKGNEEQIKNWQAELFKCKEEYEDFLKQIEKDYPNYYAIKYARSIANAAAIQKTLTAETALIEYFTGNENIYAFVITKHHFYVKQLKVDSATLENEVQQLKQLVDQPNRNGSEEIYQKFIGLSHKVYKTLVQPALNELNTSVKNLIFIPDGLLYNIAFDALLINETESEPAAFYSPENLAYLFQQFAISYNYSASLLLKTLSFKNKPLQQAFAGFAPSFKNLNYNQEEVLQINKYLGGTVEIGSAANFEAFQLKSKDSKILHLSTHAEQSIENHKLSKIQLADITITNYHIENMQIKASLVVLSACETAIGLIQKGEGAMSLSRSFFLAGCPSMVSSLWLADDESTADIMLYFYKYLKAGQTKDVALQQAKLQYCEEAGIRGNHPYYWAGFIQSGKTEVLF